jgi:hypothetical protein
VVLLDAARELAPHEHAHLVRHAHVGAVRVEHLERVADLAVQQVVLAVGSAAPWSECVS